MSPSRFTRALALAPLSLAPLLTAAAQSSVTVSPFVSYVPSAATNPLAGFALTFGGTTGLALRSSGEISLSQPRLDSAVQAGASGYRPWGADADAMLFLGGIGGGATVFSRSLSPYVFAGIGMTGADSAGTNVVRHGWSYGAGAALPLGLHADLFAEARWRMSEYVLPTSQGAPDSRSSMRFGLSFHVGGGGSREPARAPRPPRRHRLETGDAGHDDVVVVTQAPARQPVVVVTPAAEPEPEIIYVEPQPARDPVVVVEQETTATEPVIVSRPHIRRRSNAEVTATRAPVTSAPARTRSGTGIHVRGSSRSTTQSPAAGSVRSRSTGGAAVSTTRARPRASAAPPAATSSAPVQARPRARTATPSVSAPESQTNTKRRPPNRVVRRPQ